MVLELDYSADWQYWSGTESVRFTRTTTGTNLPPQFFLNIPHALRAQPGYKERAPSGGAYVGADCSWFIPGVFLDSEEGIKAGDTIRDERSPTTTWTVVEPQHDHLDDVWQLYCVALSIHHRLKDTCTFWKHDVTKPQQDAAGSHVPQFAQVGSSVNCRFQLVTESVQEGRGKNLWHQVFKVYLASEVDLTIEWQVRDAAGNPYQVVSYENRDTITDLSVVTVERYGDSA